MLCQKKGNQNKFRRQALFFIYVSLLFICLNCQNTIFREDSVFYDDNLSFLNFDGIKTEQSILELIDNAHESIEISLYSFENDKIADALIQAHRRGVRVRSSSELDSESSPVWQKLIRHGLEVRFGNNGGIMHNKYFIIDRKYLLTGSTNLSNGLYLNFNHIIILKSPKLANEFLRDFEVQYASYYGIRKDEGYDKIIGGIEYESNNLNWESYKYPIGEMMVSAYFTPYKDSFIEYRSNYDYPLCSASCLKISSSGTGLCLDQDCQDRACYQVNNRGQGEIIYAHSNHDSGTMLYCTRYENAMNRVIEFIRRAKNSIWVLAFSFRDRLFMDELIRVKQKTQLDLKVWIDYNQFRSAYNLSGTSYLAFAQESDFLKVCRRSNGALMHHKAIIIDQEHLLLGSMNFSQNAVNSNDENFLIIENAPALAYGFYQEALRIDRDSYYIEDLIKAMPADNNNDDNNE